MLCLKDINKHYVEKNPLESSLVERKKVHSEDREALQTNPVEVTGSFFAESTVCGKLQLLITISPGIHTYSTPPSLSSSYFTWVEIEGDLNVVCR